MIGSEHWSIFLLCVGSFCIKQVVDLLLFCDEPSCSILCGFVLMCFIILLHVKSTKGHYKLQSISDISRETQRLKISPSSLSTLKLMSRSPKHGEYELNWRIEVLLFSSLSSSKVFLIIIALELRTGTKWKWVKNPKNGSKYWSKRIETGFGPTRCHLVLGLKNLNHHKMPLVLIS